MSDGIIVTRHLSSSAITAAKLTSLPAGQEAWITPTLSLGTATTATGYMKDSLGFVHLRGQVNVSGTGNIFTLPAGYRPGTYKEYGVSSGGSFGVIGISTSGVVSKLVGSNGNCDLDVVTFKAET